MRLTSLAKIAISAGLGIILLAAPLAHAAGTIPLAMSIQLDTDGSVAANCRATFYQAGTVATKQNVYADFSLTQVLSNPLTCDQSGRLPMFWLADGLIHVRLTNFSGNPIIDTTMQVLGPSSGGGGGGGTVDPTAIMATGDMKARYGTGPQPGFVRANGLTIGNAASGASERANADTQALFVYLCGVDANLVMTPPRSGNCLSDYNANKQLQLPDGRGAALANLDDMGNSTRGTFTGVTFGTGNATTLGSYLGAARRTLTTPNLPPYTPSGSVSTTIGNQSGRTVGTSFGTVQSGNTVTAVLGGEFLNLSASSSFTGTAQGGTSTPFDTVSPFLLMTTYIKL